MKESITHQIILRHIYGETDAETDKHVNAILESDPEMRLYYEEVLNLKKQLNSLFEEPNATTVAIIAEHSHDSHTEAV